MAAPFGGVPSWEGIPRWGMALVGGLSLFVCGPRFWMWGLRFGVGLGWVHHQLGVALVAAPGWGALIELPHSGSPERLLI